MLSIMLTAVASVIALGGLARLRATRAAARRTGPASRIHILARVDAPNRDWAATLAASSSSAAAWDRSFEYAWLREPRYREDPSEPLGEALRPLQVVRVRDAQEQAAIQREAPEHIKLVFVKDHSRRTG